MAKKKKAEEHVNLERWMVSYADFMTLLFALFVVLYSFAMAKQSEAQAMAQSIAESFDQSVVSTNGGVLLVPDSVSAALDGEATKGAKAGGGSDTAITGETKAVLQTGGMIMDFMNNPTKKQSTTEEDTSDTSGSDIDAEGRSVADATLSSGELLESDNPRSTNNVPDSSDPKGGSDSGMGGLSPGGSADQVSEGGRTSVDTDTDGEGRFGHPFDAVEQALSDSLSEIGMSEKVELEQDEHWLTININSGMLFAEGSASILTASRPLIARIAVVLSAINNYVRVRGYTDNTFTPDGIYKNSWDLSAQRAVNVLNELENDGITPARLAVEAFGEFSPFFSNSTPAGRAQNRRVVIAISRYALVPKDLRVVNDMPGMVRPGGRNTRQERVQQAGSGSVGVVHGDDNSITLDFSSDKEE